MLALPLEKHFNGGRDSIVLLFSINHSMSSKIIFFTWYIVIGRAVSHKSFCYLKIQYMGWYLKTKNQKKLSFLHVIESSFFSFFGK